MLEITVDKNIYLKMSNLISNLNVKTNTLNVTAELKENINYIEKFRLSLSIA